MQCSYVNTKQAAAYLNLRPQTLEAWRTRGGGPLFHKFGHAVRYRVDELEAFAAGRTRRSTSDAA